MKFKIIVICSLLMLLGCTLINGPSKPVKSEFEDFSYPLEVGNVWTYEYSKFYTNIIPETNQDLFIDIPLDTVLMEVIRIDTIEDSSEVFVLLRARYDSLHNKIYEGKISSFNNNADGMYIMSIIGGGYSFPISDKFVDEEVMLSKQEKYEIASSSNNIILQSLAYPITVNSYWAYFDKSIFSIYKRIMRFENLVTKIGNYKCFVIEWIYYLHNDIEKIDYISEIGLMQRKIHGINRRRISGSDTTTYEYMEEYNLIDFTQTH